VNGKLFTGQESSLTLSTLIVAVSVTVVMVAAMPAVIRKNDAATQGQEGEQWNQLCDSTEHFKNPHGYRRNEAKTLHRL
jgi:hypothetical protein